MARSFSARLSQRRSPVRRRSLGAVEGGETGDGILFPGTGTEPNTPEPPKGGGTPSAVPLRPASYDFSLEPPEYVIEPGDTMYGIALAWYGNGARWTEIRQFQTKAAGTWGPNGKYLNANTTKFFPGSTAPGAPYAPGDVLLIPPLAAERIKARIANENPTTPASQGNAPGNDPTKPKGSTGSKATSSSSLLPLAVAGGAAFLLLKS